MPLISVIIPTYNRAKYLKFAIQSVLDQTVKDHEIIVVDDGSTDDTGEMLRAYPKVQAVFQENQGVIVARNKGMHLAKGEFVAFLDSDDLWFRDKLERQLRFFDQDEKLDMVHGMMDCVDKEGHPLLGLTESGRGLWEHGNRKGSSYETYILDSCSHLDTLMIRRNSLAKIGEFDSKTPVCEDYDFFLRIAAQGRIGFLGGKPLASFRVHTNGFELGKYDAGHIQVLKKHLALVESNALPVNRKLALRNLQLSLSRKYFYMKDMINGRKHFKEAIRIDPSVLFMWPYARLFLSSWLFPRRR